jgi:hypothetical protein
LQFTLSADALDAAWLAVIGNSSSSSSSSAALQPGVGFGLLYKVIPLLSISNQLLPVLHLEHLYIFED